MASKEWLVRSGGRLLGPFDINVIEDMLRSKELVVFDEVAQPMSRWRYIRDDEHFIKIVEELRTAEMSGGETMTQTETVRDNTVTQTASSEFDIDEMTAEISSISESSEIVYEDIDESLDRIASQATPMSKQASSSFGVVSEETMKNEVEKSTKSIWIVTALVILGVVGFFGYKNLYVKPKIKKAAAEVDLSKANRAMVVGDDARALSLLKSALEVDPANEQILLELGIRLIQIEGQTVQGRRYLQKIVNGLYSKQAHVGIGIADLMDGSVDSAIDLFRKVLAQEPTYVDAHINWGVAELEKQNFGGAALHFRDAFANRTSEGVAYLLYANSLIAQWQKSKSNSYLQQAVQTLDQFISRSRDYRQEALLLKIFTLAKLNQMRNVPTQILAFLNTDPNLTADHRHNIFIDRRRVKWSLLTHRCQVVSDLLNTNSMAKGMNAICLLKAGESAKALATIDEALMQEGDHPLLLVNYAHILFELGQVGEAQVAVRKAVETNLKMQNRFSLPNIVDARLREVMDDFKGAQSAWQRALAADAKSIQAQAGLARTFLRNRNLTQAQNTINSALKTDSTYSPLLELREQLKELNRK
ncbi:MAG: hypothetical protein KDD61_02035 [Bdellovibrionales bacterium]|nr:hypothetical protein [Bdellovibrionales bacterium]